MLIGAMNARKMLLSSMYLKFLLELGLTVTKIHSAYQFKPKQLFKDLATTITDNRRMSDQDPTKKIIGDMNKLVRVSFRFFLSPFFFSYELFSFQTGNSFFGKTIESYLNRHKIRIVTSDEEMTKLIRRPNLTHVEEINDVGEPVVYEVTSGLDKNVDRAPIIIGFSILQ